MFFAIWVKRRSVLFGSYYTIEDRAFVFGV